MFLTVFFCCLGCVFSLKIKLFGLGLSCDFLVFFISFLDLSIVFKRINYPVVEAGLIRFGYRGFPFLRHAVSVWVPWVSFLSHAVSLWFMVFSKLRWLV